MDQKDFDEFRRQVQNLPLKKVVVGIVVGVGAILVLIAATTSVYTVAADEEGVVLRFGRHTGANAMSGLNWKIPFGIDDVNLVNVQRVFTEEFTAGTLSRSGGRGSRGSRSAELLMFTGDQNIASVEWIVQYQIVDAADYLFKVNNVEETIRDVCEASMGLVVGDSSVTEVLTARRREIALKVKERMQKVLDQYGCGVMIITIELQDVTPPAAVKESFNEVNQARQEKETTINVAQASYLKAIPTVEGEAQKLLQEAEGYKVKRINEARGDVAKFEQLLEEYSGAKEVTRIRLYLEAMATVLPRLNRVYVLDDAQGGPLQILDLKDTLQRRPQSAAASDGQTMREVER